MASLTVENYLKAILQLQLAEDRQSVTTGKLAATMRVSPGTVTSMLKTLADSGLARYTPYAGVSLTPAGQTLAFRMLRRHRLLETFLAQTLDLTWDQVHEEAEHMEHAVSDVLIDRIDAFLGRPVADPHGDPIPSADGEMRRNSASLSPLSDCPPGRTVLIRRVLRQQSDFLRYLAEHHLEIGREIAVMDNSAEAGVVTVRAGEHAVTLGRPAAEHLLVEPLAAAIEQPPDTRAATRRPARHRRSEPAVPRPKAARQSPASPRRGKRPRS
ncbi:MAG: metal-dependent transcriptional regulator [Planctomycetaceae bacterium]